MTAARLSSLFQLVRDRDVHPPSLPSAVLAVKTTIGFLCSATTEKVAAPEKEGSYLRGVHAEGALEDHL